MISNLQFTLFLDQKTKSKNVVAKCKSFPNSTISQLVEIEQLNAIIFMKSNNPTILLRGGWQHPHPCLGTLLPKKRHHSLRAGSHLRARARVAKSEFKSEAILQGVRESDFLSLSSRLVNRLLPKDRFRF